MNLMGGGRPRKPDNELKQPRAKKKVVEKLTTPTIENDIKLSGEVLDKKQTPLEYALNVMNDPTVEEIRRDRMAIAALPFMHLKKGEGGRKDKAQEDAEKVSTGKFSSSEPPKLVINNK